MQHKQRTIYVQEQVFKRLGLCLILCFLSFIVLPEAFAAKIIELNIKGGIGPATADYISRGIEKGQDADLILINLDTPGGLSKSTRIIVQKILASHTPVVTYVSPSGARAASAGTFLLYASTLAAMAPGTHLGAASPVNLMGAMQGQNKEKGKQSTMNKKVMNDTLAYLRTLAQLRNRDLSFAEKAVLEASTLTASEALKAHVIDFVAPDYQALLKMIDGKMVKQDGREIKINSKNPEIQTFKPGWRTKFLLIITDPTLAYMLLLLGIYGIFFELMNPGFLAPGVIGAIAILVALYALQLLPVNYAGLALIVLGLLFIVAESFVPSFGALGLGGTVAFIVGSIMLLDTTQPSYQIARSAIWAMAAANVIVFVVLLGMAIRSKRKPIQHGTDTLVGYLGRTINEVNPEGQAIIRGEIWWVHAAKPIAEDKQIRVINAEGLKLEVEEIQGE